MNVIDLLEGLRHAIGLHRLSEAHLEVVGIIALYTLAVIWLTRVWHTRHQARRRRQLDRGLAFMDGVVGLLRVVVLLVVGVLLALARASGRSHYRW